ncbi:MAG: DUF5615 family PIN-like protein [Ignavibacteriales bacterium]|nr:DUF5615 family PIN-like protein [Ignavibacteriales bacterium]
MDEHISKNVASALRQRGADVVRVQEIGRDGFSDEEQLSFGLQEHRVIVTFDDDFLVLGRSGIKHSGIIFVTRFHRNEKTIIRGLIFFHEQFENEDFTDRIEYL